MGLLILELLQVEKEFINMLKQGLFEDRKLKAIDRLII